MYLRVKNESMGHAMDRFAKNFSEPRALDALLYRPPVSKEVIAARR